MNSIPVTSFSCELSAGISAVHGGYYADPEAECQVYNPTNPIRTDVQGPRRSKAERWNI